MSGLEGEQHSGISGFYGAKNKRKWIGLQRSIDNVVEKHHREKIPKPFPNRILGPPGKWEIFHRQQDAFNFSRSKSEDLHVFAFESDTFEKNTGQRLYLVASYPVFYHYYIQLKPHKRLHYEVIPEGAVCKLYFDLEYDKMFNPECDGKEMMQIFIQYVCLSLKAVFKLSYSRDDILDLDSSTEKKFSRHLIFQLKNVCFKNNIHAGRFVLHMMSKLLEKIKQSDTDTNDIPVNVGDQDIVTPNLHVGSNVDTDNEERMDKANETDYNVTETLTDVAKQETNSDMTERADGVTTQPSKPPDDDTVTDTSDMTEHADGAATQPSKPPDDDTVTDTSDMTEHADGAATQHSKPPDDDPVTDMSKDVFAEVLDKFSVEELKKLVVKNKHNDDVLFCDTGVYTKNRNFRLFLSSKLGKKNPLVLSTENTYKCSQQPPNTEELETIFYSSIVANVEYTANTKVLTFGDDSLEYNMSDHLSGQMEKHKPGADCLAGYSKSPYPEVDEYITSIITQDGGKGVIRLWTYFHQGELLVYEIARYRYCHNVGRHHRSNNIMLIADLQKGVWYQKCHDPDCYRHNYKSPEWPLPGNILPANYFKADNEMEDGSDYEMNDEELLNSTLELEKRLLQDANSSTGSTAMSDLNDETMDDLLVAAVDHHDNSINDSIENG